MAPDYELSPEVLASLEPKESPKSPKGNESVLRKAEDVVSSMLAKGFILGKDAIAKAKSLDEKHQLTSTASAKVASLDKKEEDLSEEELNREVQLYVTRVRDSLKKFRKRIPESDSPFHTVPETLEFLCLHYVTLKNVLKEMNESRNYLSDILAILDLGEGEKAPYLDEVDWPELGGKSISDLSTKDLKVEVVKHGLKKNKARRSIGYGIAFSRIHSDERKWVFWRATRDAGISAIAFHPSRSMAVSTSFGGDLKEEIVPDDKRAPNHL